MCGKGIVADLFCNCLFFLYLLLRQLNLAKSYLPKPLSSAMTLSLISKMPKNGVVFSDGIEEDAVVFNSGTEITVGLADKQGWLVI